MLKAKPKQGPAVLGLQAQNPETWEISLSFLFQIMSGLVQFTQGHIVLSILYF